MNSFRQSNRGFGLTFAVLFALIAGAVWWFAGYVPIWCVVLAAVFAGASALL